MRSILTRTLVAAGLVVGLGSAAGAEPALFVANDADTTIYLFGTIHQVPCQAIDVATELGLRTGAEAVAATGCAEWMSDIVAAALAAADELWVEPEDIVNGPDAGLMQELAFLDGQLLTDFVPEEDLWALAEIIAGPQAEAVLPELNTMKPWMVTSLVSQMISIRGGWSATEGVDLSLTRLAAGRGIPLRGFETAEEQFRVMAADPLEIQAADLRSLLVLVNHDGILEDVLEWVFQQLWNAWLEGDLETVAFLTLADDEAFFDRYGTELAAFLNIGGAEVLEIIRATSAVYEGLVDPVQRVLDGYETTIAQRNRNWMPAIGDLLDRPGTFFVAAGAAHFTGDAALQTLIAREGVAVQRVQ